MIAVERVTSTSDPNFRDLCQKIDEVASTELGNQEINRGKWPKDKLQACANAGVFEWFVTKEFGGQGWSNLEIVRGYLGLSEACLTTAFALTQLTGAVRRITNSGQQHVIDRLIPKLMAGEAYATVGISHLTTSRQHLRQPVLQASTETNGETFRLNGFSPWVTGAGHAQFIVTGATLADGRQLLAVVPTEHSGVEVQPAAELVGLSASQTGAVNFNDVIVLSEWVLAGPVENVMQSGVGARTGGLQTSTLALGLCSAAINFTLEESRRREELTQATERLKNELALAIDQLLTLAAEKPADITPGDLRAKCNSLALRATQSAMVAAKGAGYVDGHPAGRWCREALFFLVWSCPQPVVEANLCEFAGIS